MKWGSKLLVCARCKRSFAPSFESCPFCDRPVDPAPEPAATSALELGVEPAAEPPASIELELDAEPVPPPPPPLAGFGALEPAQPGEPAEQPPLDPVPASAPPVPVSLPLVSAQPVLHARFAAPRVAIRSNPLATVLVRGGLVLALLSLVPGGCGVLFRPRVAEVEVDALPGMPATEHVHVVNGFAQPLDAVEVDPSRPLPVSLVDLETGAKEHLGHTVELVALPLGAAILKRFRVDRSGNKQQLDGTTNIYAPLTPTGSVWAVSQPVSVKTLDEAPVRDFQSRSHFTGVVRPLANVIELRLIRESRNPKNPVGEGMPVTSDAVAVVEVPMGSGESRVVFAPVMGTKHAVWTVALNGELPEDELFGDIVDCRDYDLCKRASAFIDPPPQSLFVIRSARELGLARRIRNWGIAGIVLGIAAMFGGIVLRRRA
jgi:hypothetical protein